MLAGSPRFPSRFWSIKTTRAAKRACKAKGRAIAPCMAPLMKRKASGHLYIGLVEALDRHQRIVPSRLLSCGAGKGDCRRTLVMSTLVFEGTKHRVG